MSTQELAALFEQGSQQFALGKDDEALNTFENALNISRNLSDKESEGNALVSLGMLNYSKGDFLNSIQYHQAAAKVFKELNNEPQLGQTLKTIGVIQIALGTLDRAVQILNIAKGLAAKDYDTLVEIDEALKRAARFASIVERKNDVASLNGPGLKRSLGANGPLKNKRVMSIVTTAINGDKASEERVEIEDLFLEGVAHFDELQFDESIVLFERALALAERTNDRVKQADLLTNIAGAYYCMEPFGTVEPKVMHLYHRAMAMYQAENNKRGEARVLRNLGNVFLNLANNKLASEVLSTAVQLAREADDTSAEQSAIELLNTAQERMKAI